MASPSINIKNKKASFEYELIDKYIAGIQLTGTEIKSIRAGRASLVDSYCSFYDNELWVKSMHVSEYSFGSYNNHEPKRERKLLLNKKELKKLNRKIKEKGFSIIPTRLFIDERGYAKLEIALARGKNTYDKRQSLKQKDMKREIDRLKRH
ncbi:MAG: SsrA-binding protein [Bacteroidetes bacterium]|nr:MAG: SsrA-binding protein [Bacteroidota bacterium]